MLVTTCFDNVLILCNNYIVQYAWAMTEKQYRKTTENVGVAWRKISRIATSRENKIH